MKRSVAGLAIVGVLIAMLLAPAIAVGLPIAPPPDGQKAGIVASASQQNVYEYPVGSGAWYLDGVCANYGAYSSPGWYTVGVPMVDPHVTAEYLDAASVHVSYQTFAVDANVLMPWAGGAFSQLMYRAFHLRLTVPAGADPTKTRVAADGTPSDPDFPRNYATVNSSAVYQDLLYVEGPVDTTTLGGGRIQYTLTVTNNSGRLAGPLRPTGNEVSGPDSGHTSTLDTYEVIPNDPAKALLLPDGESTTFTVRGLAATPSGMNRYSDWSIWQEGELPSLVGTVTWAGRPLAGVTVAPAAPYTPTRTIANGSYAKTGLVGLLGGNVVVYSKPGYNSRTLWPIIGGGATTTQNVALTITPSLSRTPSASKKTYRRRHGKAKYTLSCVVKGAGGVAVPGVKISLQQSANGKTGWKRLATYASDGSGRVARSFTSKKRSTRWYRWAVASQTGVTATPKTSKQKITVR